MANRLAQEIEKILSGVVGDFIARATLKKNCELIGKTTDTIEPTDLPLLAEKIEKSVSFFSGKEVGTEVSRMIREIAP